MKNYEFMAEKYPLFNNDPKETDFPIPEGPEKTIALPSTSTTELCKRKALCIKSNASPHRR
jgi:hypothetical protein